MYIKYPMVDDIIDANRQAIRLFRATRAERHGFLLPRNIAEYRIQKIINKAKYSRGTIKHKAAILLKEINRQHIFQSANKRTSFLVATEFLLVN